MMMINIALQTLIALAAAAVSVSAQCTIGDPVVPTQPAQISGQFINLNDPAVCSGDLTAWHFCYYRSSIEDSSTNFTLFFRVWRNVQGNRYNLISSIRVTGAPDLNAGPVVCVDIQLLEDQYVSVERGDVIAVYTPITLSTVSVLALEPAVTQELHQDTRGLFEPFTATQFSRNDLRPENMYGLHLQADITPTVTPTVSTTTIGVTTMASTPPQSTTSIETTVVTRAVTTVREIPSPPATTAVTNEPPSTPTTASTASMNSRTSPSVSLSSNETNQLASASPAPSDANNGQVAAAVIIVLLVVVGIATGLMVLLACYIKRRHGSLKGFIQRSKNKLLAMDNLIYRVGSDRIPFEVNQNNQLATKEGVSPYDIPTDKHKRTLYDIPKSNTPSVHSSQNYSMVRPCSLSTNNTDPPQKNPSLPRGRGGGTATLEKSDHTYIFMDSANNEQSGLEQPQVTGSENPDGEVYIYLRYGTIEYQKLLSQVQGELEPGSEIPFQIPPSNEDEIYVVLSEQHIKVIPKKAVEVLEQLGTGHFGKVDKGVWKGSKGVLQVAIKSLNKEASQSDKVRLLQEAAVMGQFKHPNITHLHGIVTQGEEVLLILEYLAKGDLKHYLSKLRPEPNSLVTGNVPQLLVSFSQQIALGMHYLASKGFVHRDLAARNIFVSEEDICKIGDFGMSRDLSEDGSYKAHGGKVPIKWTAPEALHRRKYSPASDVWSYGCLLFEIWSLGRKPFKGIESKKVLQLIDEGYRLPPPPGCPFVIYDLMIKCWHPVAGSRPKYRDILTSLLQEENKVMDIPIEEASTHPEACLLGAPLDAGKNMYLGLQHCYNPDISDKHDPDYEYGQID